MNSDIKTIRGLLSELELNFLVTNSGNALVVQFQSTDLRDRLDIFITPHDEGAFLQLSSLLAKVEPGSGEESVSLQIVNQANAEHRVFKVFRDPQNCIRATADLPLYESEMSPTQFRYLFDLFSSISMKTMKSLRHVADMLSETPAPIVEDSDMTWEDD